MALIRLNKTGEAQKILEDAGRSLYPGIRSIAGKAEQEIAQGKGA